MLKREYRLRKKYMFNYCYKVGKVAYSKSSLFYYTPSNNKFVKIGISVSKKVGGAVQRNRARRVIREAITPFLHTINQKYNIIIVAKENILDFSLNELQKDFEYMWNKAGLINE